MPLPPQAEFQLVTRPHGPDHIEIQVDGRWRHNLNWTTRCHGPACDYNGPELAFFGRIDEGRTVFWGVCPTCGWETQTYYVGWRPPSQRPGGGVGHGWLAFRRAESGY